MTGHEIAPATAADVEIVAAVIAEAFQHLAVAHWLVPREPDRRRALRDHLAIWVDHALRDAHGHALLTDDLCAAAVWFPLGTSRYVPDTTPPPPHDYDNRLLSACGDYTPRFRLFEQELDRHHPRDKPHDHLAFLAVVPSRQRQGHGSALLDAFHAHGHDVPSYLEASSAESRKLYLRHGYRDLDGPFRLPDDGPRLWPMWRGAQ